jgi:hypothetical protein
MRLVHTLSLRASTVLRRPCCHSRVELLYKVRYLVYIDFAFVFCIEELEHGHVFLLVNSEFIE